MIVVQHWSLVELRKLYELAEKEAVEGSSSPSIEDPPPDYDGSRDDQSSYYETQASEKTSECGVRPEIEGAQKKKEDQSNALVKYQEKPLRQLDEQFTLALTRENQALGAPVYDIVNHLLQEWTYIPESESRPSPPNGHRKSYYESDESTSDSEFERAGDIGGRYIQGPRKSVPKNVRFQPRVESDEEEKNQDSQKPRRAPKRHIMHHSETDSSSESELSPAPLPRSRRSSESSNARYPHDYPHEPNDRNRRPYASSRLSTGPEHTISRSASSRGIPPSPMAGRSMPPNNSQQWQGSQPIPAFRPSQYNRPGGPQFMPPSSPYIPAGYSSQHSVGSHFSQQQQQQRPPGTPMAQNAPPPRQHRPHRVESRQSAQKDSAQKDKESASKNLKRGLFGGAAVAGILDLLQGLDGI